MPIAGAHTLVDAARAVPRAMSRARLRFAPIVQAPPIPRGCRRTPSFRGHVILCATCLVGIVGTSLRVHKVLVGRAQLVHEMSVDDGVFVRHIKCHGGHLGHNRLFPILYCPSWTEFGGFDSGSMARNFELLLFALLQTHLKAALEPIGPLAFQRQCFVRALLLHEGISPHLSEFDFLAVGSSPAWLSIPSDVSQGVRKVSVVARVPWGRLVPPWGRRAGQAQQERAHGKRSAGHLPASTVKHVCGTCAGWATKAAAALTLSIRMKVCVVGTVGLERRCTHCFARGEEGPLSRLGAVNKILAVLLLAVIGNCTLSDDHVLCEAIVIVPLITNNRLIFSN